MIYIFKNPNPVFDADKISSCYGLVVVSKAGKYKGRQTQYFESSISVGDHINAF